MFLCVTYKNLVKSYKEQQFKEDEFLMRIFPFLILFNNTDQLLFIMDTYKKRAANAALFKFSYKLTFTYRSSQK